MLIRQKLSRMTADAESLIFNGAMVAVVGVTRAGAGPALPGAAQGRHRDPRRLLRGLRPDQLC